MTVVYAVRWRTLLLAAAMVSTNALAGPDHEHHHDEPNHSREHGSHVHGIAQLDIAAENGDLYLALTSPAANIVGFEHAPENTEQKAALDAADAKLRKPDALFIPSLAAGCQVVEADVDMPWSTEHGDHKDHAHEHAQHDEDHTDISAEYRFRCTDMAALRGLAIELFDQFPNTERLMMQYVIGDRQGGAVATPDAPSVQF